MFLIGNAAGATLSGVLASWFQPDQVLIIHGCALVVIGGAWRAVCARLAVT